MQLVRLCLLIINGLLLLTIRVSVAADCTESSSCSSKYIAWNINVDQNGGGDFKTVQDAIDSVPSNNNQWIKISINPGTYMEMVEIPRDKPCIFLDGMGKDITTITYDGHNRTDISATFTSWPDNVVVRGITFKNSYNRYWTLQEEFRVTQAVAARIYGDKSLFYGCGFLGVEDTLWDVKGRHYYKSCYIEGAVDFIFGNGQSYFKDCSMNATVGMPPYYLRRGYVTAQGRQSASDPGGFIFDGGVLYGNGGVCLGRAYGPYSRVIFIGTCLEASICSRGWDAWRLHGKE
ncbi:hypothetical protein CRG98_047596 [Punica granatum]|nr:hypothetical protein CRG98_047596 [Punica granatum]